jgi:hypothetical protein
MALCVLCGTFTFVASSEICSHHLGFPADDWARGNRTMCDFLHRGIVPPTPPERDDNLAFLLAA